MARRTKEDWSMREWRDYYEKLRARAFWNYQNSGEPRYDREENRYSKIVDAFNGYLENQDEVDTDRIRRKHNIDEYAERHTLKEMYTRNEVLKMLRDVSTF